MTLLPTGEVGFSRMDPGRVWRMTAGAARWLTAWRGRALLAASPGSKFTQYLPPPIATADGVALIRLAGGGAENECLVPHTLAMAENSSPRIDDAEEARRATEHELRQVKETVAVLRDRLEEVRAAQSQAVQTAVAAANDEIRQLRAAVQLMREELQAARAERDQAVQTAVAAGHDEARQLQLAVAALRSEMDTNLGRAAEELEGLRRAHQDEVRHLRGTIAALREGLEAKHAC